MDIQGQVKTDTDRGLLALLNSHKLILDIRVVAIMRMQTSSQSHLFSSVMLSAIHTMLLG